MNATDVKSWEFCSHEPDTLRVRWVICCMMMRTALRVLFLGNVDCVKRSSIRA